MLKEYTDVKNSNYKRNADLTYSEIISFKHETESQEEMSAIEDNNTSFHISQSSSESQTKIFFNGSSENGGKIIYMSN